VRQLHHLVEANLTYLSVLGTARTAYSATTPLLRRYGAVLGTGFEAWRRGHFALGVQARLQAGRTAISEGVQRGLALDLLVGANWY